MVGYRGYSRAGLLVLALGLCSKRGQSSGCNGAEGCGLGRAGIWEGTELQVTDVRTLTDGVLWQTAG